MSEHLIPIIKKMRLFTAHNEFAEVGEEHRVQVYDGSTMIHEVYGTVERRVLREASKWVHDNFEVPDSYAIHGSPIWFNEDGE